MYILPKLLPEEILVYLRKSRTDDPTLTVEEVLAKHEQMLDEWAERNLPEGTSRIPEANRFREVASGETIDSRPAIKSLLRKIESPQYKALLVVEPQRLSRGDLEDIGRLIKVLRYTNTIVITPVYTYDIRDERDRDAFERELKRGNEFLEYQKRIMWNGRVLAVENGNYLGTVAPYGYDKAKIKEGKRYCYTLAPNKDEAPFVPMIFDMYAKGVGTGRIAQRLDELGAPIRKGGKHWSPESIRNILTNEHYIGLVRWNHRKGVKTMQDGELVSQRPRAEEYILRKGKQVPLVTMEAWEAVQEKLGTIPKNPKAYNLTNPLAGLIFCRCGTAMTRRTYKDKSGRERSVPRFACNHQVHCGSCSSSFDEVLEAVLDVLRDAVLDFEVKLNSGIDDSLKEHAELVARLEARLAELEDRELSQWDKYTREGMPKPIFDKLNAELLAEKEEVSQALCSAKAAVPEPVDLEERRATFKAALEAMADPDNPVKEQNALLKACIKRITYSRDRTPGSRKSLEPMHLDIELLI